MNRIPEPELMEEDAQARAYAEADFSDAHNRFVAVFQEIFPDEGRGCALDLGCGPGDVTFRIARAHPEMIVHGVDGSGAMLGYAMRAVASDPDLGRRVAFIHGFLPGARLPRERYDVILSNSLLHHLHDPQVLWNAVKAHAAPGAAIFIMDLRRPPSEKVARDLVEAYAAGEPEVLRRDFYNSLLAAFLVEEIEDQLRAARLRHLDIRVVSDRHVLVAGKMPA